MFEGQGQTQQATWGQPVWNGGMVQQVPKIMNVLSADEIKELQQQRSQFSLGLTDREAKQAACNHRSVDGMSDSLVYDQNTNAVTCQICGYTFKPLDANVSPNVIQEAADNLVDILQTIKIMYTDIPGNAAREYFQIIPLIAKVPQLFEFAAKSFNKHEFDRMQYGQRNMNGMAMLQSLNALFGAAPMQQPVGGYGYGYVAPQPQPMNPPVGYPNPAAAPVGTVTPFGYPGASQQPAGYQPMTAGYAYTPNAAAPVAAPASTPNVAAPAAPAEVPAETTVTETVTV